MRDAKLISSAQLEDYDLAQVTALLQEIGVFSLKPPQPADTYARHSAAIEQITFLLNQHNVSHIAMAGQQMSQFILTPVPAFSDAGEIRTYLQMLSKIARLIPSTPSEGPTP